MLLAQAISKTSGSLAEAQNTYKENVIVVNTWVTSVLTSSLPTLNQIPPDWQDFVDAYTKANQDALNWVNNVMARLLDVPDEVQNYNSIVTQLLSDAQSQANTLVSNPGDSMALQILQNDLKALTNQLNLVTAFISGAVSSLQQFKDVLPDMAVQLQAIADKSATDANADQQKIDTLKQDIANLQAEIKSLTASIVALAIVDGVALTLGTVATIAAWPFGALTWLVMGPAVAVASVFIALDSIKLVGDKAQLEADQQQVTGLTQDVATLQILAQNYTEMANQTSVVQDSLQSVLAAWQVLASDVSMAVNDIQSAIADAGSANFSAVVKDLDDAVLEWNAAYGQAGDLHLDLQVNNAELQIGMTADQVQAATASAQTLDIIQYYNQLTF